MGRTPPCRERRGTRRERPWRSEREVYLVRREEEWGMRRSSVKSDGGVGEFFAKADAKRLGKVALFTGTAGPRGGGGGAVRRAVAESPVLVVGRRGCCLSHVVKRLLQGLGVNPAVHEVADEAEHAAVFTGDEVVVALPAVFVGALALALGYYYGRMRGFTQK
ncbi:hypothetical protein ZWY2020_047818 [Hordeum vulgare]|nr:hypothetical protein ZWY2020_047818 [Hordeum vulgare]